MHFENFRENFIFKKSVKRHICHLKNVRLWHDLPTWVNDRVISPFREALMFTNLCVREVSRKLNLRKNFRIYSTMTHIMVTTNDALTTTESFKMASSLSLTHLSRVVFPLLSIGLVHFRFKGCWLVVFIFSQILIENSVSKQWRP